MSMLFTPIFNGKPLATQMTPAQEKRKHMQLIRMEGRLENELAVVSALRQLIWEEAEAGVTATLKPDAPPVSCGQLQAKFKSIEAQHVQQGTLSRVLSKLGVDPLGTSNRYSPADILATKENDVDDLWTQTRADLDRVADELGRGRRK